MSVKMARVADWEQSPSLKARVERCNTVVTEGKWNTTFQDVAVTEEMKNFLTGVQSVMPNLKFMPFDDNYVQVKYLDENVVMQTKSYCLMTNWLAYYDDYPFNVGYISFNDHSAKRNKSDAELTYGIYSRKINNVKYHSGRDQHHMVMTKDLNKAVKLAKTYLVPFTTQELAKMTYDGIQDKAHTVLYKAQREMRDAVDPLRSADVMIAEMMHLIKQGAQFATAEFKRVAGELEAKVLAYKEQEQRQVNAYFVRIYNIGEDTYADLQEASNIRHNSLASRALTGNSFTHKMSELPEDIAHAVASLSILEKDQYVDGVGMKIDERHFWVQKG